MRFSTLNNWRHLQLLFLIIVRNVAFFVVVRSYFKKPQRLNFNYVSHEFLGSEYQFVIDDPVSFFVKETGAGVTVDCLRVFDCSVIATFLQLSSVVEEPRSNSFPHICKHIVRHLRQRLIQIVYLNPLTQLHQLLLNILCTPHRPYLHKVFHAPLRRVLSFFPLLVHIQ